MRGVMSSLPLSVFNSVIAPEPQAVVRGYATAAVLLVLVLILFVIARLLARPPSNKPPLRHRIRRTLLPARRTALMPPTAVPSITEEST
jgi:phosphate transport system permease protein